MPSTAARTLYLAYPRYQTRIANGGLRDGDSADVNLVLEEEPEALRDIIHRRRLSVDGAVRARASSSPERLQAAAMTITRAPAFVSSPKKHRPLQRALSVDEALLARAASRSEPSLHHHRHHHHHHHHTITFVSSPKKHLPSSPGAVSPPTNLRPNPEFDFRRTRQELPPSPGHAATKLMQLQVQSERAWVRDSLRSTSDDGVMLGAALALSLDQVW